MKNDNKTIGFTMKNMKRGIVLIVILFLSGCNDYLDVNNNPNSPESTSLELRIPALISGFSFKFYNNWPSMLSADFTQQISQNGDPYIYNIDWYQLGQPWSEFNNVWNSGYATIGKNARFTYIEAEEQGLSNVEGISKLIFVWTMSMMTDLYGSIPYTEAFQPSNSTPTYQPQEEIYPELMTILDEAIAALEEGGDSNLGSADLIYNGDMTKWTRMAYTLKAILLMRLTEAPDNNKQQRASDALNALSNGFQSNNDNAVFTYQDESNGRNPWYRTLDRANYMQMSAHYIGLLQSLNDPRISIHAQEAEEHDPGENYVGHENGALGIPVDSVSAIGTAFAGPDAPGRLMDYAEAKFLEAQALLITQGPGAANSAYKAAIRADMEDLGVSNEAIATYTNNRIDLEASDNPLRDIIVQKYIANFLSPEVWNDWRKTGYPALSAAQNPNGENPNFDAIPRRYPWPGSELTYNLDQVEALNLPMNAEVMLQTVWWDTR